MDGGRQVMRASATRIDDAHRLIHSLQTTLADEVSEALAGTTGSARLIGTYASVDREFEAIKRGLDEVHHLLVNGDSHG